MFARSLKAAWAMARAHAAYEARLVTAPMRPIADLRREIEAMENTDRLGREGQRRLSDLCATLRMAEHRERALTARAA